MVDCSYYKPLTGRCCKHHDGGRTTTKNYGRRRSKQRSLEHRRKAKETLKNE